MRTALLSGVFLLSAVAHAQSIYTWEDANGQHFTNDPSTIPKGAVVRTTQGADISRVSMGNGKPKEAQQGSGAQQPAPQPAPVAQPEPAPADDQPAAPSQAEITWRRLFRDMHNRIAELETQIETDRKQVEETSGLPLNGSYSCMPTTVPTPGYGYPPGTYPARQGDPRYVNAGCVWVINPEFQRIRERLETNRRELGRAKQELEDLERRAGWESVPREWRK